MFPPDPNAKAKLREAVLLAASSSSADHEQLLGLLDSKSFLFSIQPEAAYLSLAPKRLQVARIVKTLMDSPHAIARETLVKLIGAREFVSLEQLQDLLIIALVVVSPLPPVAVAFLDRHSTPDSAALHLAINTLAANESEPALVLFEKKIADPEQEFEARVIWLRDEYLVRRNDVPILKSYRRMIVEGTVPPEMRLYALESLCRYQEHWYLACTRPKPPLRLFASKEAKAIIREILRFAINQMELSEELKLAVRTTELEIGDD